MRFSKNKIRVFWGIVFLLLIYSNFALADENTPGSESSSNENHLVASILQKHISDLNNQSKMQLNQGDKEKFVQVTMFFNYLIVMAIASFIVFRTRTMRHPTKRVFKLRH